MNKNHQQSNDKITPNDLFRLPPDRYSNEAYSENFIQLFKKALNKVYSPKKQSSRLITEQTPKYSVPSPKYSLASIPPIQKTSLNQHTSKKSVDSIQKQSFPNYLTERQKLINQILTGKTQIMTSKNKKLITKRCKTLQNLETNEQSQGTQRDPINPKIPLKLHQAFNSYRNKSINEDRRFPPISNKLSPNAKKTLLQNLEIINKYRMLEAQYRSKEFMSTPIQIFSCSTASKRRSDSSKTNIGISKLTKQSIIRSKSRKIKYALDRISRHLDNTNNQNPQNPQMTESYRLDTLIEQDQILKQMWKQKQKTIQSIKGNINKQNENMMKKKSKKKKLISKEPLDEYFRPWQNASQVKQQSQLSCHEIFPNTNTKNTITQQQNNQQ